MIRKEKINMCDKASICPEYKRRIENGIKDACEMCEFIKQERKKLFKLRITLLSVFIIFIITTYYKYSV